MASGTRPSGGSGKKVLISGERRYCPVCNERLSAYNPGPHCYTHTVGIPWRGPTAKPR